MGAVGAERLEAHVAHVARAERRHDRALGRLTVRADGHIEQVRERVVHAVGRRLEVHALEVLAVGAERLEEDRVVAGRDDVRRDPRAVGHLQDVRAVALGDGTQARVLGDPDRRPAEPHGRVVELVRGATQAHRAGRGDRRRRERQDRERQRTKKDPHRPTITDRARRRRAAASSR